MTTERVCSVDGCPKKRNARGLCNTHYKRFKKEGNLPAFPQRECLTCGLDISQRNHAAKHCLLHAQEQRRNLQRERVGYRFHPVCKACGVPVERKPGSRHAPQSCHACQLKAHRENKNRQSRIAQRRHQKTAYSEFPKCIDCGCDVQRSNPIRRAPSRCLRCGSMRKKAQDKINKAKRLKGGYSFNNRQAVTRIHSIGAIRRVRFGYLQIKVRDGEGRGTVGSLWRQHHRYVMEQHLGRPLRNHENVHHPQRNQRRQPTGEPGALEHVPALWPASQ